MITTIKGATIQFSNEAPETNDIAGYESLTWTDAVPASNPDTDCVYKDDDIAVYRTEDKCGYYAMFDDGMEWDRVPSVWPATWSLDDVIADVRRWLNTP